MIDIEAAKAKYQYKFMRDYPEIQVELNRERREEEERLRALREDARKSARLKRARELQKVYRARNVERYGKNHELRAYRKSLGPDGLAILAQELHYGESTLTGYELGYNPTPAHVMEYIRNHKTTNSN